LSQSLFYAVANHRCGSTASAGGAGVDRPYAKEAIMLKIGILKKTASFAALIFLLSGAVACQGALVIKAENSIQPVLLGPLLTLPAPNQKTVGIRGKPHGPIKETRLRSYSLLEWKGNDKCAIPTGIITQVPRPGSLDKAAGLALKTKKGAYRIEEIVFHGYNFFVFLTGGYDEESHVRGRALLIKNEPIKNEK